MAADQPRPRFEPPPWEQEAFERFRKEQEELRAKEELNAALRAALDQPAASIGQAEPPVPATAPEDVGPTANTSEVTLAETPSAPALKAESTALPESKVAAMLIELRREEEPVKRVNIGVVNGVMGFMVTAGLYIIIRALLLASDIQTTDGANTLMASTVSLVVFVTGCAFLGGAYFLFRKYHR